MKLTGLCSQCGRFSNNPQSCSMCGAIVCESCYRPANGICKVCATRMRTQGLKPGPKSRKQDDDSSSDLDVV